jgi:hypothetical protein
MPHLLRTVVLHLSRDVHYFIKSLILQLSFWQTSSRLALDYPRLVHRFWSTECREPLASTSKDEIAECGILYPILRNVQSLGIDVRSQYLLYNGLSCSYAYPKLDWRCHRLTFGGKSWRWNPFTSTPEGLAFLGEITHLVVWFEDHNFGTRDENNPFPAWLKNVPFSLMPALTHFVFPVLEASPSLSWPEPQDVRWWLLNQNPHARGYVENLKINVISPEKWEDRWELAFLQNENEEIWAAMKH